MAAATSGATGAESANDQYADVGKEVAAILRSAAEEADRVRGTARHEAAEIVQEAREDAERLVREATEEAREILDTSFERLNELEQLRASVQAAMSHLSRFEATAAAQLEAERHRIEPAAETDTGDDGPVVALRRLAPEG